jgi:hypothetical protein
MLSSAFLLASNETGQTYLFANALHSLETSPILYKMSSFG